MTLGIWLAVFVVLPLGLFGFNLYWACTRHRVTRIVPVGDGEWRCETETRRLFRPAIKASWLSSGGGWLNEDTAEEVCSNWGGGDSIASEMNSAVWQQEDFAKLKQMQTKLRTNAC